MFRKFPVLFYFLDDLGAVRRNGMKTIESLSNHDDDGGNKTPQI